MISNFKISISVKQKVLLFFVFVLAIKLFFFFKLHVVLFCGDSSSYLFNTYNLIDGLTPLYHTRPPGYSFFIFLVWKIFGNNYFNVVMAQIIVSVFAWTILFFMFTKYFSKTKLIFFFLVLLSCLPFFWLEDYIIYSESLSLSLFICCIALYGLAIRSKSRIQIFLFSLLVTFSILTKSSLLPLVLLLVLLFLVNYNYLGIWINLSLSFLPLVIFLALYSFHNHKTLGSFSLFKFGDFARMMSVNFIIDESFSDDKEIKKALNYYCGKIDPKEREIINNINSAFETDPKIREIYSKNCDNIYFYNNYMSDSLKRSPFQIYSSTKDYVSLGRKKNSKLYINYIVNNFVSFLYNTKQGEKYPISTINQTHTLKNIFSPDILYKEHLKAIEFSRFFISVGFQERQLPSLLLKIMFRLNQALRSMLWFIVFLVSFVLNFILLKRTKFKDTFSLFGFSLAIFSLAYIFLIVTTGSASVDRYSLFSDLVMYLSLIFLVYSINKLFPQQINGFKNKFLPAKIKA